MTYLNLITALKAWPTREERLRKGLLAAKLNATPVDNITESEEVPSRRTKLLKLRAAQRARRRKLSSTQRERGNIPEAKL